jgi:ribosomal protein S30
MALNDILVPRENALGKFDERVLTAADIAAAPTSHTHGNLTNAGAIGTTANLPVKTGTSGVLEAGAFGTAAGQFAEGNDTRIATIASGSITTADGGGFIDTRGTGSIGLGVTGTRTTLTGTATANRALSLPNASGTLALSPAETYYNITATSIGSPQQIDLSASPFIEATEVRSVLNNNTGIVYVQIYLPIDSPSIVPKFRFYGQISGAGDILYVQLIRESDVVFPASGSGYEELNNGETLEVVWNGTAYGLTPNAPFMRRITLPDASGTIALTSDLQGEVRSDFVSPYTYTGIAPAGTSQSTASWKIRRSEFDAAGTHVATLTATAVSWNNRLTASYS